MNRNLILLLLLFTSNVAFAQSAERADELKLVIEKFFDQYSVQYPPQNNVKFSKKPDGYYVVKLENFLEVIAEEKFLDIGSKAYKELTIFPLLSEESHPNMYKEVDGELQAYKPDFKEEYLKQDWIFEEARKYPFYGYEGFYNDVIVHYERMANPTAKANYAYCRALSIKLLCMLYDDLPNAVPAEKIVFPSFDSKMTDAQFEDFRLVLDKEIAAYKAFSLKYPAYETKVGNAKLKYAHIVMDGYLKLFFSMSHSKALTVIEPDIYEDAYLQEARQILDACPKNSVLYTWGDNDTYPFYYLQAYQQYRNDVIIINLSLTLEPKYMLNCYAGPYGANELQSSFEKDYYRRKKVVMTNREATNSLCAVEKFLKVIDDSSYYYDVKAPIDYVDLPCDGVKVELPKGQFGNGMKKATLMLERNNYPDIVSQIDILFNNGEDRNICFTKECIEKGKNLWQDYLKEANGIYILNEL